MLIIRRSETAVRSLNALIRLTSIGREEEARTVLATVRAERGRPLNAAEEYPILEHMLQSGAPPVAL